MFHHQTRQDVNIELGMCGDMARLYTHGDCVRFAQTAWTQHFYPWPRM